MLSQASYLFLEVAVLLYLLTFCYEQWRLQKLLSPTFLKPALLLALAWVVLDLIAVNLRIWSFPATSSLPIRILGLPIEECMLFFLHTLVCYLLVENYLDDRVE